MTDHDYLRPVPLRVGLGDELRLQLEGLVLLLGGGDRAERVAEEVEGREEGVVHVGLDGVVGEDLAGVLLHHEDAGRVGGELAHPQDGLLLHHCLDLVGKGLLPDLQNQL